MKNIFLPLLICCLCVGTSIAQEAQPCCGIIGINAAKGIITSRNSTTGKVQQ